MMSRRRHHDGFTLIEVLVAMALALIVLTATLSALNVFTRDSQAITQRNDAQNQARLAMDRMALQLRNIASPITQPKLLEDAGEWNIVFQTIGTPSGQNTSGAERVRYCIPADTNPGTRSDEALFEQVETWSAAAPPTMPSSWADTSACPDPNYPYTVVNSVMNRYQGDTSRCAFAYNGTCTYSGDLSAIDTVGIDLFVNPTPGLFGAQTELRSAVYLRNEERSPVASFTYTPLGNGSVLLNAGTSYSPSGESLAYRWSCSGSVPCTNSGAVFVWKPGSGTYTVTLTVTDQAGLPDSQTQTGVPVT